jgi:hypothetical protein
MIAVAVGCAFHGMYAGQPEGPSGSFNIEAKNDTSEDTDQALYEKGMQHLKTRQFEKARQAFQSMIQSYPESMLVADAYLAIGDSYYEQGGAENLLQAKEQYQNFIVFFSSHPKNVEILTKVLAIGKKGIGAQDERVLLWAEERLDAFLQNPPDSNQAQTFQHLKNEISQELARLRLSQVTGYAFDSSGNPLQGVMVSLAVQSPHSEPVIRTASTNAQGHFVIRGAPMDQQKVRIQFIKDGFAPAAYDGANPHSDPIRISMNTAPPGAIERVLVRGNKRITEDTVRFYIKSQRGQTFDKVNLALDVAALKNTDFFDDVKVDVTDGDTGKIITFAVIERPLIRSIEFVGNRSFSQSEILDALKEAKTGLTVNGQFEYRKLRAAEDVLHALMARHGKPNGTVRIEIERVPPNNIRLRLIVNEDVAEK